MVSVVDGTRFPFPLLQQTTRILHSRLPERSTQSNYKRTSHIMDPLPDLLLERVPLKPSIAFFLRLG